MKIIQANIFPMACALVLALLVVPAIAASQQATVDIEDLQQYRELIAKQQARMQTTAQRIRSLVEQLQDAQGPQARAALGLAIAQQLDQLESIAGTADSAFSIETDPDGAARVVFTDAQAGRSPRSNDSTASDAGNQRAELTRPDKSAELIRQHEKALEELAGQVEQGELSLPEYFRAIAPHVERIELILSERVEHQDAFADSQYKDLEEDEVLSKPAFEEMEAGISPKPDEDEQQTTQQTLASLMQIYHQAIQRLQQAVMPLTRLLMEGKINPAELDALMSQHSQRMNRASARLQPAMEKLAREMQRQMIVSLGADDDTQGLSPAEVEEIRSAVHEVVAEINALTRQFEYVVATAQQRAGVAPSDED